MIDAGAGGFVGAPMRRVEDPRFLLGRAHYIDDIVLPHMVHAAFIRSPVSHGVIRSIDVADALEMDDVWDVVTGNDIENDHAPIRCDLSFPTWQGSEWPVLAHDRVRFVGEPVAMVVASDRYVAEDAVQRVIADIDSLPVIASIDVATKKDAPLVHPGWRNNLFLELEVESDGFNYEQKKDLRVAEFEFQMARHSGIPIECCGCIASWDSASSTLHLYSATQIPHMLRSGVAEFLRLPENRVRVTAPDVGGGFGIKGHLFPEELACCIASMRLGLPVKWVEDRREHFLSSIHAREHSHRVEVGYDEAGVIHWLDASVFIDAGAYSAYPFSAAPDAGMAAAVMPGPYRIRNYRRRAYSVATNKCPFGPYRGVGRPAACFSMERVLDQVAHDVGLDVVEVRRRNLINDDEFPYESVTGMKYDSGRLQATLDGAVHLSGLRNPLRPASGSRLRGRGVAMYIEQTAQTGKEMVKRGVANTFDFEMTSVRMDPTGRIRVQTSVHSHGQGHETILAQIVADELGVDMADVHVSFGDTDQVAYGSGTFSSRSAVLAGGAAKLAAEAVREKLFQLASHLLKAPQQDLVLGDRRIHISGAPDRGYELSELARLVYHRAESLPEHFDPMLEAVKSYDAPPGTGTFSNAAHVAEVEIDVETGHVYVVGYWVMEDCGRVINPLIVEGQVHGGVTQGIGSALFEELVYDREGQLLTTTFMDYLLPGAPEVPPIGVGHIETPSPFTLGGIKGMGEGGAIAPGAAIASAVEDAIRNSLGPITVTTLPLTPERVLAYVDRARSTSSTSLESVRTR